MREPKAICVLGMHRSGTSLLTRLVNIHGVHLGEDYELIPPLPDSNPEGFWERIDVNTIHNELLGRFKRTWDSVLPMPEGWLHSVETEAIRTRLLVIAQEKLCPNGFWAWKDPRTMLVLPMWQDILKELGAKVYYIFIFRNPLDVARSLAKRDSMTVQRGISIWFNYNICALKALRNIPVAFVAYDNLLLDCETEIGRCADELNIAWPVDDEAARSRTRAFVRPELRHSASTAANLASQGAHEAVSELFGLLKSCAESEKQWSSVAAEIVDDLYTKFISFSYFCSAELDLLWDCNNDKHMFNNIVARQNNILEDQETTISSLQEEIIALEEKIREREQYIAKKEQEFQSVINSASWKVTNPIRSLLDSISRRKFQ